MGNRMDNLEKEVEEMRVALKASQGWTNRWVDTVKELGAQLTSFRQDHLDLVKQHGDLVTDTRANALQVVELEAQLARQETRMANLVQRLERTEVRDSVDLFWLISESLIAGRLSVWSYDRGWWVTKPDLCFVGHRAQNSCWAINSGPY